MNLSTATLTRALSMMIQLLSLAVISRGFLPDQIARFALCIALANILWASIDIGVKQYIISYTNKSYFYVTEILFCAILTTIVATLFSASLIMYPLHSLGYMNLEINYLLFIPSYTLLLAVLNILSGFMLATRRFTAFNMGYLAAEALGFIFIYLIIIWDIAELDFLFLRALLMIITLLVIYSICERKIVSRLKIRKQFFKLFTKSIYYRVMRFQYPSNVLYAIVNNLDKVIISTIFSAVQLANYDRSKALTQVPLSIFNQLIVPYIQPLSRDHSNDAVVNVFGKLVIVVTILSIIFNLVFKEITPQIISLFLGSQWDSAADFLLLMMWNVPLSILFSILNNIHAGQKNYKAVRLNNIGVFVAFILGVSIMYAAMDISKFLMIFVIGNMIMLLINLYILNSKISCTLIIVYCIVFLWQV